MDMTYLLGVPLWCPDAPVPSARPVVWYMRDEFRKPQSMQPDLVVPLSDREVETFLDGIACHESQFFEWLPFDMGIAQPDIPSPGDRDAVREFLKRHWFAPRWRIDAERFGLACGCAEVYELSEYGRTPSSAELAFIKGTDGVA